MKRPVGAAASARGGRHEVTTNETIGPAGRLVVAGLVAVGVIIGMLGGIGLIWFIPYASVGALLAIRRPRTSIGWILLGLSLASVIVVAPLPGTVQQFGDATLDLPIEPLAILQGGSGPAAFLLYALLATVFPSGRLPRGSWGVLARVAMGVGLFFVAATYVMPMISVTLVGYPGSVQVRNPVALFPDLAIWRSITPDNSIFPVMVLMLLAAVSLIVRARSAHGIERQQLRWIAAAIGLVVSAVACGLAIGFLIPGSSESGLAWIPAIVAFLSVPASIGIAVLRYRLYEIDRIISRTIGYALITAILAAVFLGTNLGLQTWVASATGGSTLAVAASTLLVAGLFQPLRRAMQVPIDRRFNRAHIDGQRTLAAFGDRVREEVDLARLSGAVLMTADEAVRPAAAGLWLRGPAR